MSMITTASWVPRGFAAPFPQKYDFDEEEFERIAALAKLNLDDANDDLEEAKGKEGKDSVKDEYDRPAVGCGKKHALTDSQHRDR